MRWRAQGRAGLVVRCRGVCVGWVERDGDRWLARVRFEHVHVLAVFVHRGEARRFVERELWSEAGELAPPRPASRACADAGAFCLRRDLSRAAAVPVHGPLRSRSAE